MNATSAASATARYTPREELANTLTHGLGLLLALVGGAELVVAAVRTGTAWHVVGCTVFAISLILLYSTSTCYHSAKSLPIKQVLRTLDHSAIFVLIAGSYTPFTLVTLRGAWGWSLLGVVWALAIMGVIFEWTPWRRFRKVLVSLYLAMGWTVMVAIKPLIDAIEPGGLWLLVAGGLCYTGGVLFFVWRSLPFNHALWHLWVLAGSVSHFLAVRLFVVPS